MKQNTGLKGAHSAASSTPIQRMGLILDHLVDALGGDSSSPLRRAQILIDIDHHPEATQTEIMDRLSLNKSTMSREIDWLYDHGCLLRQSSQQDGRVIHMVTCGYSKKSLGFALDYANHSHESLQNLLEGLITLFTSSKPTLRDAKLLVTAADLGEASRQELFARSYKAPSTTNVRTLESLVDQGLIITETSE